MNYQRELNKKLEDIKKSGQTPSLLLHSCCAPCSTYVLEYLSDYFDITVYYYNPNIYPESEYTKRIFEQQALIEAMETRHPVAFLAGNYDRGLFYQATSGMAEMKEGQERCFCCYELRLREAARVAADNDFDYFTTTLSISPLKKADKLNEIGVRLGAEYQVAYLTSDFKKNNGYKRSLELSREYRLYRQDYCGCEYSYKRRMETEQENRKGR